MEEELTSLVFGLGSIRMTEYRMASRAVLGLPGEGASKE